MAWDADPALLNQACPTIEDLLDQAEFRAGFSQLAPLGLSFDALAQQTRLTALARAFPDTRTVLNHCGGIVVRRCEQVGSLIGRFSARKRATQKQGVRDMTNADHQ